jgi:hypothetical protein
VDGAAGRAPASLTACALTAIVGATDGLQAPGAAGGSFEQRWEADSSPGSCHASNKPHGTAGRSHWVIPRRIHVNAPLACKQQRTAQGQLQLQLLLWFLWLPVLTTPRASSGSL